MSQHLNVYMEELWAGRKGVLLNSERVLSVSSEAASLHQVPFSLSLRACLQYPAWRQFSCLRYISEILQLPYLWNYTTLPSHTYLSRWSGRNMLARKQDNHRFTVYLLIERYKDAKCDHPSKCAHAPAI